MSQEDVDLQAWQIMEAYLSTATPEQWHIFVARSNYDSNLEELQWLVDQPKLDRATALMLYWNLGAGWYVQYASEDDAPNDETYRLLRLIEERYGSGYYIDGNIWFDPKYSDGTSSDDYSDVTVRRPIPNMMLEPVRGKEYVNVECDPEGFYGGVSEEVFDAIHALYGET